nr:hypothetical protein [Tanacetum cinerariifolium]
MSKSTLKLVDKFVDEGVLVKELAYLDEEADIQQALELSLKEQEKRTQDRLVRCETKSNEPDISVANEIETKMEVTHTETPITNFGVQIEGQGGSRLGKAEVIETERKTKEQIREEFTSTIDQFLNDKSSDADKEKTNVKGKVKSMVTVTIQQDTSFVSPM